MRQITSPETSVQTTDWRYVTSTKSHDVNHQSQRKIVPLHVINTYMHTIAPPSPNLDSSRRWVLSLRPRLLCPTVKTSRTYWIGSRVNPRASPDTLQKRKIILSCQGSNPVPPASSSVTILTELHYSTVFANIMIKGHHFTFQKLRLLHECETGLQNTDDAIINGSESSLDNYEGSVGTLLSCSLRASHRISSVVNLYESAIITTKWIIFKICFMF